ncbi:AEC family transporter [Cyanobium sp. Cruz-8H5]|uniref:AEC family transporter n=1 Tax=Cyanobium sp. Cruz-8H5 TaxID=2823712 RepID=UPI0020CCD7CB|nr:AEC family transporter [Cyanobium sp. Cruz-8H5]MCP9861412.1 AEC family transporter [Cyanobium sp. Cruz-8H5]
MTLPALLVSIITTVLAPILLMIGIGAFVRYRFKLDLGTLAKLNLWVFGPAFVFDKVANSTLAWSAMGGVVLVTALQVACLGALVFGIGKAARVAPQTLSAVALATMFYNAGNYGIPLAELAFPSRLGERDGAAIQAFVVLCQNLLNFTLGMYLATRHQPGRSGFAGAIASIFTLPAVPVVLLALLARTYLQADPSHALPVFISKTTSYLSLGLVPVALVTLGAQLATEWRWPRWRPIGLVLVLRLLVGPALMTVLLYGLHLTGWLDLWPWPAELLIITAAVPTAVNTLLLTIETNGDTELAADCVFWTTILSPLTLTLTIACTRLAFG